LLLHVAPLRSSATTPLTALLLLLAPLLWLLATPLLLLLVLCTAAMTRMATNWPAVHSSRYWTLLLLPLATTCLVVIALWSRVLLMFRPILLHQIIKTHVEFGLYVVCHGCCCVSAAVVA
jgi:hypothetical protein